MGGPEKRTGATVGIEPKRGDIEYDEHLLVKGSLSGRYKGFRDVLEEKTGIVCGE